MYKAIVEFYDLADDGRKYRVGDTFPRPDLKVSDERIAYLLGSNNKLGKPVIENAGKPEKKVSDDLLTRDEVEKMQYFSLKSLATKHGIDLDGKKVAELRAEIIEKLNL